MVDVIRTHPGMARFLFEYKESNKMTSKMLQKIFKPELSPKGSNRRSSQEIVLAKFLDFVNCTDGLYLELQLNNNYL